MTSSTDRGVEALPRLPRVPGGDTPRCPAPPAPPSAPLAERETIVKTAHLSPCGTYRYSLGRTWDEALPPLVWIMLNPSTADAEVDDPTIRRVVGFTQRPGCYGAAIVVNLYALRSPKPVKLATHADPVGPLNDFTLKAYGATSDVMAAWGAHAPLRAAQVLMGPLRGRRLLCLGRTKQGHPLHPLYVRADRPFEVFR